MLKIKIITPQGLYKEGEVEAVRVRTVEGETTILPNHMPIVAMLAMGSCSLKESGQFEEYAIAGGMLQMANNEVRILCDAVESKKEIDIERAKKAKERAESRLSKKDDNMNIERAEAALAKAMNRIKVHGG